MDFFLMIVCVGVGGCVAMMMMRGCVCGFFFDDCVCVCDDDESGLIF